MRLPSAHRAHPHPGVDEAMIDCQNGAVPVRRELEADNGGLFVG